MTGGTASQPLPRVLAMAMVGLVALSPVAGVVGAPLVGLGMAANGVHYVTDSGFEVNDASGGAVPRSGNPFPDSDTLALPDVTLSAAGNAYVRLEQRTGTFTNLSAIDDQPDVTVDPNDKRAVVLKGGFDSIAFRNASYESSNSETDLVYTAGSQATARFENTGLSANETVEAIDVESGTTLNVTTVSSDGSVTFTGLDAGTHSVNLKRLVDTGGVSGVGDLSTDYKIDETGSDGTTDGGSSTITIDRYFQGDELSVSLEAVGTESLVVEEVRVSFDMGTTVTNEMTVRAGSEPPADVPAYDGVDDAQYVSVDIDGNLADRVLSGSFTVRLNEDTLPADPDEVTARHYQNGEWQSVAVSHLGGQRFEIRTSDYSTFAIIPQQQAETTTAPATTTTTPTVTATTSAATSSQPTTTQDLMTTVETPTTQPAETTSANGPSFGISVAVFALLGAALLARRRQD